MPAFSNFNFWIITSKVFAIDEWIKRLKNKENEILKIEISIKKNQEGGIERKREKRYMFWIKDFEVKINTHSRKN